MSLASDAGVDAVMSRVITRAPSASAIVSSLLTSRQRQQVASREIERGIRRLAAMGITQRDIAALAGLSQAEVSRRLKRDHLSLDVERLRQIVARRDDGTLNSEQMMDALAGAIQPRRTPGRINAYDGASSSSPAIAELMNLYKSEAITRAEYAGVRTRLSERKRSR